jgi:hypothetical protein
MTKSGVLMSLLATMAIAAVAIFGAGSASATVLCKTATNPCTGGTYGEGTVIKATLAEGQAAKFTSTGAECHASEIGLEVTKAGGSLLTPVSGTITALSFTKCGTCAVGVLKKGTSFSIRYTAEGKGSVELSGVELTAPGVACALSTDCFYAGNFANGITLEGGGPAAVRVQAASLRAVEPEPLACGHEILWYANFEEVPGYTVTAPESLYVEGS